MTSKTRSGRRRRKEPEQERTVEEATADSIEVGEQEVRMEEGGRAREEVEEVRELEGAEMAEKETAEKETAPQERSFLRPMTVQRLMRVPSLRRLVISRLVKKLQ